MYKFRRRSAVNIRGRLCRPSADGNPGDWIIIGAKGGTYPIEHDVFIGAYEPVDKRAREYFDKAKDMTPKRCVDNVKVL